MVRETALTKSYHWFSRGRWGVEEGGLRLPTRQGWQMERCGLAPPAPAKEAEVELSSPASFCAWYKVVVLLQQGESLGSTSLGPRSVWMQTSLVHWNGDKSTDQTSLSSQPIPGQGTCMWPRAFLQLSMAPNPLQTVDRSRTGYTELSAQAVPTLLLSCHPVSLRSLCSPKENDKSACNAFLEAWALPDPLPSTTDQRVNG